MKTKHKIITSKAMVFIGVLSVLFSSLSIGLLLILVGGFSSILFSLDEQMEILKK